MEPTTELPALLSREDVIIALDGLGIPRKDLLSATFEPRRVTVVYRRCDADGLLLAAGDELATVTTTIGIT